MRMKNKIAGRLGLVAAVSAIAFAQPASAQYFNFDNLRNYVGIGPSERHAPNQGFIRNNIDTAQARLDAELHAGISSGAITSYEAAEVQARLGHIASLEASFLADGGFSYGEVQQLMSELSNAQSRIQVAMTSGGSFGGGYNFNTGWGYGWTGGNVVSGSQIDQMQNQLRSRISQGVSQGRLTRNEARNLISHLDNIAMIEANLRASGRGLTRNEADMLRDRLRNVRSQLQRDLNDRQFAGRYDRWF